MSRITISTVGDALSVNVHGITVDEIGHHAGGWLYTDPFDVRMFTSDGQMVVRIGDERSTVKLFLENVTVARRLAEYLTTAVEAAEARKADPL